MTKIYNSSLNDAPIDYVQGNLSDLPAIVELNQKIFAGLYDWPLYDLDQYQNKLKDKKSQIYLAKIDQQLVDNSIAFTQDEGWYIWIMGVDPNFCRRGIARRLTELNEEYAASNNYQKVLSKVYNVSKGMLCLKMGRGYNVVEVNKHSSNSLFNAVFLELILVRDAQRD